MERGNITFYTGSNTEATLAFRYSPVGSYTNGFMYIDDFVLIKDEMAEPSTYADDDFSHNTAANWGKLGSVSSEVADGKLKVAAESNVSGVQSRAMLLKKGYTYTLTATVDLSNLSEDNWLCWSVTNAASTIGSLSGGSLFISDDSATTTVAVKRKGLIGSSYSSYNLTTGNPIVKTDGAGSMWYFPLYDLPSDTVYTYDLSASVLPFPLPLPKLLWHISISGLTMITTTIC